MHPIIGTLLRKARRTRLTSTFSLIKSSFTTSNPPARHIKIDDEERHETDSTFHHPHQPSSRLLKMVLLSLLIPILLLLTLAYLIYKPPHLLISSLAWLNPSVLWRVNLPSTSRVVGLTIDDAPSEHTGAMLDLLSHYGAKATFFVIGSQIAAHPDLLQRMHDEGHEIGNHAWRDEPSVSTPLAELERQIIEMEALLPPNPGGGKYFRPGSGVFSGKLVERVMGLGYRVCLGSIYPHDAQIQRPRVNARHVLSMLRPGGIVIMHDRRSYSAEQLDLVLKGMAAREWKAESLGGLLRLADEVRKGS